MSAYSDFDAARDIRAAFGKAPAGAVSGEWFATTEQAGVSSQSGGYLDADGGYIEAGDTISRAIRNVVEKLEASRIEPFNTVTVRWTKSKIPFMRGSVRVDVILDEAIVPRGPDSNIYEAAAVTRRAFWSTHGDVADGFAAERGEANVHNQTKWFGPHRRVLAVKTATLLTLATDGLSTPWAGVAEPENGVECELFMEFDTSAVTGKQIDDWAHVLIGLGDLVADGHRVAADVERHGAIVFCRLADDYSPMTRIILSGDRRRIKDLPFGSVPLIRVTPIAEAEIEDQDQSGEWAVDAARHALTERRIEF